MDKNMKLIVIDDESIVVDWVKTVIERSDRDYEIVGSAGNGIRGLAVIRQKDPDIVITDIRIPGVDGLTMIERILEEYPHMVFIVISGYREFEYAKRAIELQVVEYIDKPLNQEKLFCALEKASERVVLRRQMYGKEVQADQKTDQLQLRRRISEEFVQTFSDGTADETMVCLEHGLEEMIASGIHLDEFKDECVKLIYLSMECIQERCTEWNNYRNVVPYLEMRQLYSFEEVKLYTKEIVCEFLKDAQNKNKDVDLRDIPSILAYIEQNYTREIGLSELAEQARMSPAAFSSFFKEQAGVSYIKYLTKVRLDHAKELLRKGMKPSEIAEKVGYSDYRYFSQVFKKSEQMTPGEFREKANISDKKSDINDKILNT